MISNRMYPKTKSIPDTMKTTKSIIIVLFMLLTAQIASAYYCPSTGRWLSRDPAGEPGFENIRAAGIVPSVETSLPPGRWINRDSAGEQQGRANFDSGPNLYDSVGNNPMNYLDPFGLAYGNPVSGPDGPVGPSDPYAPGGPYGPVYNPPPISCKDSCFYKYILGITVSSTVVVSGQPILEKRFVAPDSAEGTSIAGKVMKSVIGNAKFQRQMPTLTQCCRLTGTRVVSRFAARWIPFVGWVWLDIDVSGMAGCMCGCPPD